MDGTRDDPYPETVERRGMRIELDVPLRMDDGVTLRADVYRPTEPGRYPVILSYGRYGKWLHFADGYPEQWSRMANEHPAVFDGTSGEFMSWEVVDPEKWVPDGYAVVRVDSRGSGRSPGFLDVRSHRERLDYAECIEWAGEQAWSNGKVGLNGISYYAINQWQVAALRPKHLAAMCVWEGASDRYRDGTYHGGIYTTFSENWYSEQAARMQYGVGENGVRSRMTGAWTAGPETLTPEELGASRADLPEILRASELVTDEHWEPRVPDLSKIDVPLLSAGNWGGHGLHLRGNVEGFLRAGSDRKWLEVHGREHWTEFYTDYGLDLQKRFFGHFLKGERTGWEEQPPVQLQIRRPDGTFVKRHEEAWPIPRTQWTRLYLDAADLTMSTTERDARASAAYRGFGRGLTFLTDPLEEETEITGPIAAKVFVSTDTEDADLFLVVRLFEPNMEEVVFRGAVDPHKPIALGWLRASHRKLDAELSEEWRPVHTHDEVRPLEPGEVYELDVEVWPTSVVAPEGSRLGLSIRGKDYEYPEDGADSLEGLGTFSGVGPHPHDDPEDRPPEVCDNTVTIHTGPSFPSHVLLPVVPER